MGLKKKTPKTQSTIFSQEAKCIIPIHSLYFETAMLLLKLGMFSLELADNNQEKTRSFLPFFTFLSNC